MMPVTIEGVVREVLEAPGFTGNDGSYIQKWEVFMDNGHNMVTYSPRCAEALTQMVRQQVVILAETRPDQDDKVVEVRNTEGQTLFVAKGRGGATPLAKSVGGGGGYKGGGGGGRAAYRNTEEGEKFTSEQMNRRTALMQAVKFLADEEGMDADVVLSVADTFYGWLQK